jgi:hypothetical protein
MPTGSFRLGMGGGATFSGLRFSRAATERGAEEEMEAEQEGEAARRGEEGVRRRQCGRRRECIIEGLGEGASMCRCRDQIARGCESRWWTLKGRKEDRRSPWTRS